MKIVNHRYLNIIENYGDSDSGTRGHWKSDRGRRGRVIGTEGHIKLVIL